MVYYTTNQSLAGSTEPVDEVELKVCYFGLQVWPAGGVQGESVYGFVFCCHSSNFSVPTLLYFRYVQNQRSSIPSAASRISHTFARSYHSGVAPRFQPPRLGMAVSFPMANDEDEYCHCGEICPRLCPLQAPLLPVGFFDSALAKRRRDVLVSYLKIRTLHISHRLSRTN